MKYMYRLSQRCRRLYFFFLAFELGFTQTFSRLIWSQVEGLERSKILSEMFLTRCLKLPIEAEQDDLDKAVVRRDVDQVPERGGRVRR